MFPHTSTIFLATDLDTFNFPEDWRKRYDLHALHKGWYFGLAKKEVTDVAKQFRTSGPYPVKSVLFPIRAATDATEILPYTDMDVGLQSQEMMSALRNDPTPMNLAMMALGLMKTAPECEGGAEGHVASAFYKYDTEAQFWSLEEAIVSLILPGAHPSATENLKLIRAVYDVLVLHNRCMIEVQRRDAKRALYGTGGIYLLAMYQLESLGFANHHGSVPGSLTYKGVMLSILIHEYLVERGLLTEQ